MTPSCSHLMTPSALAVTLYSDDILHEFALDDLNCSRCY